MLPVSVPVNSITLLDDSAVGDALAVVNVTSEDPATLFDRYPPAKASKTLRLLLVLSPQVPEFSPDACSSSFNLSENVDGMT